MSTTVAIVEDDANVRRTMVEMLRRAPGLKFAGEYASAEEALRGIPQIAPHVVLMDVNLPGIDGVECLLPEGAFYAFPSVTGLYGRTLRGRTCTSSAQLAELAIEEAKVAVVPGEAFGSPGYFRMSYALGDDDRVAGVSRLAALFAGD